MVTSGSLANRRRVDWSHLEVSGAQKPTVTAGSATTDLASLLSALDEMLACESVDAILRRAVDIAKDRIGLIRVSLFLLDEPSGLMRGTWGTDLQRRTVDEHFITFDFTERDRVLHEELLHKGVYWTVVENAPLVVHTPDDTQFVGRGWVCCTPVRAGKDLLAMMFNDAGLTSAAIDNVKQEHAVILSSLLGSALDRARRRGQSLSPAPEHQSSPQVFKITQLLSQDPALTAEELGRELKLSASRVARIFKSEVGMSLVEHRNRLRLERFNAILDERGDNLLEAAMAAGFGSYAQFHRVFLSIRGTTPGSFLRSRAARQK